MESSNFHHHGQIQQQFVGFPALSTAQSGYGESLLTNQVWNPSILMNENDYNMYMNSNSNNMQISQSDKTSIITGEFTEMNQKYFMDDDHQSTHWFGSSISSSSSAQIGRPQVSEGEVYNQDQYNCDYNFISHGSRTGGLDVGFSAHDHSMAPSSLGLNLAMNIVTSNDDDHAERVDHMVHDQMQKLGHQNSSKCSNKKSPHEPMKKSRLPSKKSPCPPLKVRKEKVGDRVATLHRLVAPFGKTDTASVLTEAIGYIQFLQDQIQTLSMPYMKSSRGKTGRRIPAKSSGMELEDESRRGETKQQQDLTSRGLCLVPSSLISFISTCNEL